MSAAIVRQSLAVVDSDFEKLNGKKRNFKKSQNVLNLMPENHKIKKKFNHKGRKVNKDILTNTKKVSLAEARLKLKSKEQILKENLEKLKLIKEACTIDIDKDITSQIIERARTRRPVKTKNKNKNQEKTVFTEEDFQKFEAEYFDE